MWITFILGLILLIGALSIAAMIAFPSAALGILIVQFFLQILVMGFGVLLDDW